jgi:hypothetical protein
MINSQAFHVRVQKNPDCIFIPGTSSTLDGFFNKLAGPEFFFET